MSTESRPKFTTVQMTITNASEWYTLPAIKVGDGCEVVVKSSANNTAPLMVAHNDDNSKNTPFILDNPGDSISLRIKNTDQIVISSEVPDQVIEVITEQ